MPFLPLCVIPSKCQRVDTRVLQVIYSFPRGNLPIYIGQQMDVYIDAPTHPLNARVEVAR